MRVFETKVFMTERRRKMSHLEGNGGEGGGKGANRFSIPLEWKAVGALPKGKRWGHDPVTARW